MNTVGELMGDKSLAMGLRYSNLSCDHNRRVVDLLGQGADRKVRTNCYKSQFWKLSLSELFENTSLI